MDTKKTSIRAGAVLSVVLVFSSVGMVQASGLDTAQLSKGYSLVESLTEGQKVSTQYGEGIINTLKNSAVECPNKAFNTGNGDEIFYFSTCGFPNVTAPKFEADNELLNLWQMGHEDIRENITNKAKFGVYTNLFNAIRNSYAIDEKGDTHFSDYTWQDAEIDKMKKNIPPAYLFSQSGSYKVSALDFLWRTPEIAPQRYFTLSQKEEYEKFEKKTLTLVSKLSKIKDTKTLEKLRKALEKTLKNGKVKTGNDTFLLYMVAYRIVLEGLGNDN